MAFAFLYLLVCICASYAVLTRDGEDLDISELITMTVMNITMTPLVSLAAWQIETKSKKEREIKRQKELKNKGTKGNK